MSDVRVRKLQEFIQQGVLIDQVA
ncbi:hypothetical protein Q604_UNBC15348G0001, partial [human gut metagenome]